MTKSAFLFFIFLFQLIQITACAQTADAIPPVGGISFAPNGELLHFNVSGGGQDIAVKGDLPWSLITGTGNAAKSYKANRISVVSAKKDALTLSLSSSNLPNAAAVVELASDGQNVKFTVERVSGAAITGVSAQFQVPEDFDCQLGYPPYAPFHHSCSNARGTVAAFCITGNCENKVQYDSNLAPRFGATLSRTPIQELNGSSFVIFTTPQNPKTLAFLNNFSAFRKKYGTNTSASSSLFFTSLPEVKAANCGNDSLCSERVQSAAKSARNLGFDEVILEGNIWVKTTGEFDARPELNAAIKEFKKNGVCPILHTLVSELSPYNVLCTPNAENKTNLGGANYRCPTNAAKSSATGQQYINRYGQNYLWDGNQPNVFNRVTSSFVKGLENSGACGLYADSTDWFGEIHPQLSQTFIADIARNAPNLRLRATVSDSPSALYVHDVDWTDVWQILNSRTPKDWTLNWGYQNLQGWSEHLGINGRLGWIPPPRADDTPETYLPMLNAAVATGSFVTIETSGDDASLTSPKFSWFRTALKETIDAVKEIRAGGSEGMPVVKTARYDLTDFSSGVSTVALFDSIVPAANGSKLDARSYGVKIDKGNVCRAESASAECFYFKGTPLLPASPASPRLTDGGSFLFAPGDDSTRTKNFTLAAWVKADEANATGGIFEKTTMGYGLYMWNGQIGGHTTGNVMGTFYNNPYVKLENPQAWNHFVYSYNDSEHRVKSYLNGKLVFDQQFPSAPPARVFADAPIFVGTNGDPYTAFRGWLDGITLYNRVISDSEAASLFRENKAIGNPVISWSASNSAPTPTLDINLETQRVVYLVPMLENSQLPAEKIRLTFTNLRGKASSAKIQTSLKFRRIQSDSNTLIIEIDSNDIKTRFSRIAVNP